MELQAFLLLPLGEQVATVWEHGTFLGTRLEGGHTLVLYHLQGFFAEVWYQPESDEVALVLGSASGSLLGPYLETIDLPRF